MPDLPPSKRRPLPGADRREDGPPAAASVRPYAELRCRTNFSFLEGASHPDELVNRAGELGYAALAITDRNSVAGVVRAHAAAKETGLKLLIGAEVTPADAPPVVLLATDRKAYGNLCRLLTLGRRRAPKGECELTFADVAEHAEGLLACVPLGPFSRDSESSERSAAWVRDRRSAPLRKASESRLNGGFRISDFAFGILDFISAFPGRCYALAELHLGPNDRSELRRMMRLAADAGVPLVASNDVHYHVPQRRFLQDVLTAIRHGCTVAELGGRMFPNAERYLKSAGQMRELFADCPDAVARTAEVAARCTFSLDELRYEYPHELCPPGTTPFCFLERLTWDGAHRRFPHGIPAKVRGLIEHELRLIEELRYETYFLTVWDLVRFARGRGILCQGRGSAANSVVCYCLEVTSVDPERIDVLFERFISKERDEAPDIDVDFEHERREEVIQYVYEKYGRERAGMAATVICYRARSAVRDVGKALGLSLDRVDVIAKSMSHHVVQASRLHENGDATAIVENQTHKRDACATDDQFATRVRDGGLDPQSAVGRQFVALTREILDFPRHLSQHVGGLVLTEGPLCEMVPIENAAMADRTVIQWDKDDLDTLGLLKVDCLALGMLTAIRKAFDLIEEVEGRRVEGRRSEEGAADSSPLSPRCGLSSSDSGIAGRGAGGEGTPGRADCRLPARPPSPRPSPPEAGGEGEGCLTVSQGDSGWQASAPHLLVSSSLRPSDFRPSDLPTCDSPGRLTLAAVPAEDSAVYEMIQRADTIGVFQIESRAQMSMLPRLRPNCYYDLVIEVAIVRPGPIQGDMVHPYLRRRSGEEPVDYPDERIREVLAKTMGVPIFQEQAMRLAVVAAGFTPGEADQLRRAMGAWRKRGVMEKFRRKLLDGMAANGYSAEFAERLFKQISGFGEYGFPESHAASFALLVYVSAWLKRHHPAAFTAALLNSQPMGFYAPAQLVDDARKHGVEVREVDVNASGWDCGLEVEGRKVEGRRSEDAACGLARDSRGQRSEVGGRKSEVTTATPLTTHHSPLTHSALRLGFRLVKGLPRAAVETIVAARDAGGEFTSFEDFTHRTRLSNAVLKRLAAVDAFGSLQTNRRTALWKSLPEQKVLPLFDGKRAENPKSEIRNRGESPKSEIRNPKEIPGTKSEIQNDGGPETLSIRASDFDFPSDFAAVEFEKGRISDFASDEPAVELPPMSPQEEVVADYRTVGLSLRGHPVQFIRPLLERLNVTPNAELANVEADRRYKIAGLVLLRQRPSTAKGITFVTLEDETGTANLIVRQDVWDRFHRVAARASAMVAHGLLQRAHGVIHLLVDRMEDLSTLIADAQVRSRDFR